MVDQPIGMCPECSGVGNHGVVECESCDGSGYECEERRTDTIVAAVCTKCGWVGTSVGEKGTPHSGCDYLAVQFGESAKADDPTPEEVQARRGLHCLFIAVDEEVTQAVNRDVLAWVRAAVAAETEKYQKIRVIFDGPPGSKAGRFVEVEDLDHKGLSIGEWIELDGDYTGMWALELTAAIRGSDDG